MDVMQLRRNLLMQNDGNFFDIKKLWKSDLIIGTSEKNRYVQVVLPNDNYVISTNVPDNTNKNVASVFITSNVEVPTSGSNGVFLNRPRSISKNSGNTDVTRYVFIRIESSGGYLVWDEESFAPYYIKIEKAR